MPYSELRGSHLFLATNIHSRRLYLGSSLQQALFPRKLHSSDSSLACTTRPGVKGCSCSADTLSEHRWSEIVQSGDLIKLAGTGCRAAYHSE